MWKSCYKCSKLFFLSPLWKLWEKPVKFSTSVFLDFQGFPGVFHKFFLYCYSLLKNNLSFFLKETEELS